MTQIIDHGKWVLYQPDRLPEYAPLTALFARRESDGVDWYDYVRDGKNFFADTVKFTVLCQNLIVGAATRDATRLFPAGALVRELTEFHGRDPQAELEVKRYDPDSNTLHDWKPIALPVSSLEARVAAIEAKLGLGG
jgi:hypothetical protein